MLSLSLSPSITSLNASILSVPLFPLDNINVENNENIIINEPKHFKINIEYNKLYPDIKITIPLQLLMILPPSCSQLIENEHHRDLMTNINKGVLHYYPINFNIDTYLKKWLWLCSPKLPDIDIEFLNSKI